MGREVEEGVTHVKQVQPESGQLGPMASRNADEVDYGYSG